MPSAERIDRNELDLWHYKETLRTWQKILTFMVKILIKNCNYQYVKYV